MKKIRIISVPFNDQGMKDMENDLDNSEYVQEFKINEKQFYTLFESGIFNVLNRECDVLIDDFETELIDFESLLKANKVLSNSFENSNCYEIEVLLGLISLTIEMKKGIYFHF
ncbi:hypothetical protein LOZ80_12285 [Paenibacillus sp. HWE-109]|uniref:hypothetical protein n=1 Tax=Paenibacillus sp. HWE-109 TaxID=1306526 RepID=UPI001EDD6E69|nr:hypothetical protein [Paenibacillus sp. HWE-109]UKS29659.1 hypothetical protein LOZ80_12285 [Paenibacillus sp. HWE-109]